MYISTEDLDDISYNQATEAVSLSETAQPLR